jgi:hypothetical protein
VSAYVRPVALSGADQAVLTGPGVYRGFTIREAAGSTAVVRLFDNDDVGTGTCVEEISLAANESAREFYEAGIWVSEGLWVEIVSGTVTGSVRIG